MKAHLKRHSTPKTWPILRKAQTFITRPHPSGHKRSLSLPLIVVLRDVLGLARNAKEVALVLQEKEVLVDGKPRTGKRQSIGLFDVLSLPSLQQYFRVGIDRKGRLAMAPIGKKESTIKICKVIRKGMVPGGKVQIGLHDGSSLLVDKAEVKPGDSVTLSLPDGKITGIIPLKVGAKIMLTSGRHGGTVGTVKQIEKSSLTFEGPQKKDIQTLKDYAIVVGEKQPLVTVTP